MNIRKTLLLTLIVAIAALGLTLAGCEQKAEPPKVDHPSGEHPTADACCSDDPSKCCASKAVDEAKEAVKTCCGDDPSKCCASKAIKMLRIQSRRASGGRTPALISTGRL
jgi:hypothetical protein